MTPIGKKIKNQLEQLGGSHSRVMIRGIVYQVYKMPIPCLQYSLGPHFVHLGEATLEIYWSKKDRDLFVNLVGVCCHPHVMTISNEVCLGDAKNDFLEAMKTGDLVLAVSLARQILEFPNAKNCLYYSLISCRTHREVGQGLSHYKMTGSW